MMWIIDDDLPWPPPPGEDVQQWACGPFGFWPLTFPWGDGVSWGQLTAEAPVRRP